MIKYEDYLTKGWELNTAQSSQDFIRSDFDYNARQRRALRGTDRSGVKMTIKWDSLLSFKRFWIDLNYGTDSFLTDQPIFGDPSKDKTVRFTSAYQIKEVGCGIFILTASIEITQTNIYDEWLYNCPITPEYNLEIGMPLTPCGTP